jgi:hypothetical protein
VSSPDLASSNATVKAPLDSSTNRFSSSMRARATFTELALVMLLLLTLLSGPDILLN